MKSRFSLWSAYWIDLSPEEAVDQLGKNKVYFSELSDEHGFTLLNRDDDVVKTGREFRKYALERHVNFFQGHLWLGIKLCDGVSSTIPLLKKWIELFEAIGIKRMILHLDDQKEKPFLTKKEILDQNVSQLKKIVPFLRGKKIVICLENLVSPVSEVEDLLYVIEKVEDGHFGICLDTGHLNCFSQSKNQTHFIEQSKDYLKALHIADNEGTYDQHLMPYGKGTVDFAKVFRSLSEVKYDGIFNYEIPGERNAPLEIRSLKVQYLKKVFNWIIKNYFL